jgi:hypothetical protein
MESDIRLAEAYATTKTLLPYVLAAVNTGRKKTVFAVSAVQDELRIIRRPSSNH